MNYALIKELMKQSETECGFNPDKFAQLVWDEAYSQGYAKGSNDGYERGTNANYWDEE